MNTDFIAFVTMGSKSTKKSDQLCLQTFGLVTLFDRNFRKMQRQEMRHFLSIFKRSVVNLVKRDQNVSQSSIRKRSRILFLDSFRFAVKTTYNNFFGRACPLSCQAFFVLFWWVV